MRIGLISDTHMPQRWNALPAALGEVFAGCDLILHAGDLGELWVLDQLSRIAPVAAVHGNDDTAQAQSALPYQLVVARSDVRILLCHSHHPEAEKEAASRIGDDWVPKLRERAAHAISAGASVYVFGHLHRPLAETVDGVLLVNPGAIASPNAFCRQVVQSVAVLSLDDGSPRVEHIRLDSADEVPAVDLAAGFAAAGRAVIESIVSDAVLAAAGRARSEGRAIRHVLHDVVMGLAPGRWWRDDRSLIEADEVLKHAPDAARAELEELLT